MLQTWACTAADSVLELFEAPGGHAHNDMRPGASLPLSA